MNYIIIYFMRSSSASNSDSHKSKNKNSRSPSKSPQHSSAILKVAPQAANTKLRVEGINKDTTSDHLTEVFGTFGVVLGCVLPSTESRYLKKSHVVVEYSKENEADLAMTLMDGAQINGSLISVKKYLGEGNSDRERSREKEKEKGVEDVNDKKDGENRDQKPIKRENDTKDGNQNGKQEKSKKEKNNQKPIPGRYRKDERKEDSSESSGSKKHKNSSRGSSRSSSSSLSGSSSDSSST